MWITLHADANGFTVQKVGGAPPLSEALDEEWFALAGQIPMFDSAIEMDLGCDVGLPPDGVASVASLWQHATAEGRLGMISDACAILGILLTLALKHPDQIKLESESGRRTPPTSLPS